MIRDTNVQTRDAEEGVVLIVVFPCFEVNTLSSFFGALTRVSSDRRVIEFFQLVEFDFRTHEGDEKFDNSI